MREGGIERGREGGKGGVAFGVGAADGRLRRGREEGMWVSTIKNDTLPTGNNDDDTSRLFGRYLLVKVFFSPKKFQSLRNIRVRLQFNSRYLQT